MKTRRSLILATATVVVAVAAGSFLAGVFDYPRAFQSDTPALANHEPSPESMPPPVQHRQPIASQRNRLRESPSIQDSIRRTIMEQGPDAADVRSMILIATANCSGRTTLRRGNGNENWAAQYIDQACVGFDSSEFSYLDPPADVRLVEKSQGAPAAAEFALSTVLDQDEEFSSRIISGWYLIEHDKFPRRDSYALDDEALARAFSGAIGLELCRRLEACSSHSLMTAGLCESMDCKPGTSYPEALRLRLTGAEFQSATEIAGKLASGQL